MTKSRLNELFGGEDEAILLLNEQGDLIYFNSIATQLLNLAINDQASIFSLVSPDIHSQLDSFLKNDFSDKSAILKIKGIFTPKFVQVPIKLWLSKITTSQEDLFIVILEAIVQHTFNEEPTYLYKTIADYSPDIVSVYDADFNCYYVSINANKKLGHQLADYYTGSGFLQFIDSSYRDELRRKIEKDTQKGVLSSEYRYIADHKNGKLVKITNYLTRIYKNGKLHRLVANEQISLVETNIPTYNQTTDRLILADANYTVSYVSPGTSELLESIINSNKRSIFAIIHPDDHPKLLARQVPQGVAFSTSVSLRLRQSTFSYQEVEAAIDRLFNDYGQLAYTAIRWSEPVGDQSDAVTTPPTSELVALFFHDDLTIQYASPLAEKTLGYTSKELVGKRLSSLVHDDSIQTVESHLQAALSQFVPNLACLIKKKDGSYQPFDLAFRTIKENGALLFTTLHAMNSIDPKIFQLVLDQLPDAVFLLSDSFTILEANSSATALLRAEKSKLIGTSFFTVWDSPVSEQLRSYLSKEVDSTTKDIQYTTPSGYSFWGNTTLKALPSGLIQQQNATLLRISDITDRKNQEIELKKKQSASEESMQSREKFLSQISHEIRTPLNAVLGMTHLMLQSNPREDQKKLLQTLKFSGENLTALINDILDLSKIEAGQLQLEKKEFNLSDFIQGIKLTYKSLVNDQGVIFRLLIEDEVPTFVMGDVNRLGQVLNNLLNNAVKFTEEGQIVLSIYVEREEEERYILLFEVADTGIGIPEDKLSIIFEPYQQAGPSKYGGTGLGLSIVKNIVEIQEGKISVQSTEGKGTTFRVALPFSKSSQPGNAQQTTIQNFMADFQSLEGLRVLYVEDVIPNQLLMEGLSDKWNVQLDTALNGLEALQKVKNNQYDLILMDIQMPEMDGYQATREIRNLKDSHYENIPIIALTASVSDRTKQRIQEIGMDDYISKPIDPKDLHRKLAELAKTRSVTDSSSTTTKETQAVASEEMHPDYEQLRELYLDDPAGYIEILEQIQRLTLECFPVIITSIRRMDEETLRFNCHKIMSYVRLLHLSTLELLLNQAKGYVSGQSASASADRLIQQLTRQFDKLDQHISSEINTHSQT